MEELLASLVKQYGKDGRVYSVSFDAQGVCHISVITTETGNIIARYTVSKS